MTHIYIYKYNVQTYIISQKNYCYYLFLSTCVHHVVILNILPTQPVSPSWKNIPMMAILRNVDVDEETKCEPTGTSWCEVGNEGINHFLVEFHYIPLSSLSISPDVIHSISWPISAIPNARWIVRQQYVLQPWGFSVAKWNAGKDTRKETTLFRPCYAIL